MDISEFPKIHKVKESIKKLNSIGLPKYNHTTKVDEFVNNITKVLSTEFGFLVNTLKYFRPDEFKLPFFRVREMDSFLNINLIREHSYPPIHLTKMGRCNFPEYPVFYCSNNAMTALIEVVRNYGGSNKKYCLSKWEINPTEQELIFQSFLQSNLPAENHFKFIQQELIKKILYIRNHP